MNKEKVAQFPPKGCLCSFKSPGRTSRAGCAHVIHLEAFSGYMNVRLGWGYVTAFLNWFCRIKHAIALVAVDFKHRVMGYVVGEPMGYAKSMFRDLFGVGMRALVLRSWLVVDTQVQKRIMERVRMFLGLFCRS